MIDLKQKELKEWQSKNFGNYPDDALRCAIGMAEEVGEVCHHVLKGTQKIREGINGINKEEVADGVADALIYGLQLLSTLGIDAEKEIAAVIEKVLQRDWKKNPSGPEESKPVQSRYPSGRCCCISDNGLFEGIDHALRCSKCKKIYISNLDFKNKNSFTDSFY